MSKMPSLSKSILGMTAIATVMAGALLAAPVQAEPKVEVLHYWTSGGE